MSNLISAEGLHGRLSDPDLLVFDGSWYLPAMARDPDAEYRAAHVPGALRFDIDAASDAASPWPHMLPRPEQFAAIAGALGIGPQTKVVVYDGAGLFSAARVWWMFKVFGHEAVQVLDGGFPGWREGGFPVETSPAPTPTSAPFQARLRQELVADSRSVADALASGAAQVVDVRAAERFRGAAPEPRAGVRAGHMPGALNLPYPDLVSGTRLRPAAELRRVIDALADPARPIITSCGSGVTAAILTLALDEAGYGMNRLYDGSWTEWGSRADLPVASGISAGSG